MFLCDSNPYRYDSYILPAVLVPRLNGRQRQALHLPFRPPASPPAWGASLVPGLHRR